MARAAMEPDFSATASFVRAEARGRPARRLMGRVLKSRFHPVERLEQMSDRDRRQIASALAPEPIEIETDRGRPLHQWQRHEKG